MPSVLNNSNDFLGRRGMSTSDLTSFGPSLAADEALLLVGSVPEGLANDNSDVDLLILGNSELKGDFLLQQEENEGTVNLTKTGVKINHEVARPAYLQTIAKRMGEMANVLRDPSHSLKIHMFSEIDVRALHRIRTGLPLKNTPVAESWRRELYCDALPGYLTFCEVGRHFSRRQDAIGELQAGHTASSLWMLRESVDFIAGAVLASLGETNPYLKWRIRLLQRHRDRLGAEFVDSFVASMTGTATGDIPDYVRHVIELCDRALIVVCTNCPEIVPALQELRKRGPSATSVN